MSRRHLTIAALVLSLFARIAAAAETGPAARLDDDLNAAMASQSSEQDGLALEQRIGQSPEDRDSRIKLLGYYSTRRFTSKPAMEANQKHVFWFIEHEPEARITGSPYCHFDPHFGAAAFEQGKLLWLKQVDAHPKNTAVLGNAAGYLLLHDQAGAEKLLTEAQKLEPADPQWPQRLAQLHSLQLIGLEGPGAERDKIAQRASKEQETALALTKDKQARFYMLPEVAKAALKAGDDEKASTYASELLKQADENRDDWNFGNAVHHGNIVLGQVALNAGDIAKAKEHLILAGKTTGSPQLNSFGPSMRLAKELLAKGEKDAVIEYLNLCQKFWKMDNGRLDRWKSAIENGSAPDFGANLVH